MSEWISVKEKMPPLNTFILMAGGKRYGGALMAGYHNEHDEWLIESCSDTLNVYPPEFWMPLPDPPKVKA